MDNINFLEKTTYDEICELRNENKKLKEANKLYHYLGIVLGLLSIFEYILLCGIL